MIRVFFADSDSVGSKLIRAVTGGDWSHCGILNHDGSRVVDSLMSAGGVTEYGIGRLHTFFPRVRIVTLPLVPYAAYAHAKVEVGKPYDYAALLSWLLPFRNWEDHNRWYCSELVAYAINRSMGYGYVQDPRGVSPSSLFDQIEPLFAEYAK
jgi:uncharacterized protein YycO